MGIFILIVVFCIGMKAGEFREELRSMYGGYYRGYPMMQQHVYNGGGEAVPVTDGTQGSATGTTNARFVDSEHTNG